MTPVEVLKSVFGHDQFLAGQEEIINYILDGKDCLAILPTGGGKSVCYQIPGLIRPGLCLVISPLIALMLDQAMQLKQHGIQAEVLHSGLSSRETDILLDNCIYGKVHFLFISPERLQSELFVARVKQMDISLLAVDEAHCISQWGHEFRPAYREIRTIREWFPELPCIALTASATLAVASDICEQLDFRPGYGLERMSFARENLSLIVRWEEDKDHKLLETLEKVPGSAIVYVRSRKSTAEIARFLHNHGQSCTFYHAGLSAEERANRQLAWQHDRVRVMVATNAFGMGINKTNVRLVMHYDLPSDMESYYQEAGRAGRDGIRSFAGVLLNPDDLDIQEKILSMQYPSKDMLKRVYQALSNYYKLAIGSITNEFLPFDITEFSSRYHLNPTETYHALTKLELAGLIQLNTSVHLPSRIIIRLDKTELYKFEIANARFEPIVKQLLRLYGGELYNHFTTIHESQLAKLMNVNVSQVVQWLQKLEEMEVVEYRPSKQGPQLLFTTPRQDVEMLSIDYKMLETRKQQMRDRWHIMKAYVRHNRMCRMRFIQRYFGEESTKNCGKCDICLEKQRLHHASEEERLRHHVMEILGSGPHAVEYLMMVLDPVNETEFVELIRQMVDAQEIRYLDNWKLVPMNYAG